MILSKFVVVGIGGKNIKHYKELGYNVREGCSPIEVLLEHLTNGSNVKIDVECDYCHKVVQKSYRNILCEKTRSIIKKDCCKDCISLKNIETNLLMYGVENNFHRKEVNDKVKETNLLKYGFENPTQNVQIREKRSVSMTKKTVDEKEDIRNRTEATCLERYGLKSTLTLQKCRENLFKTQNIYSSQQKIIFDNLYDIYGDTIIMNYSENPFCLDMALFVEKIKIDIEYDSLYWHYEQTDRKRDEVLKSRGYKIIRIRSGKNIPETKDIIDKINNMIKNNKSFSDIVMKDWNEEYYRKSKEDR